MPRIELLTRIEANIELVFDLSKSVDLHMRSTKNTHEKVVAGRSSGMMNFNETVTWRATHLGVRQNLTSKITELEYPNYFVDEMQRGVFVSFRHEHLFESTGESTRMKDRFDYVSPFGLLGRFVDFLFLKRYMKNFLLKRNQMIKQTAETEEWKNLPELREKYQ